MTGDTAQTAYWAVQRRQRQQTGASPSSMGRTRARSALGWYRAVEGLRVEGASGARQTGRADFHWATKIRNHDAIRNVFTDRRM
jgi:hypothetical protein